MVAAMLFSLFYHAAFVRVNTAVESPAASGLTDICLCVNILVPNIKNIHFNNYLIKYFHVFGG